MISKKESPTISRNKTKILVICASGIGNTILFTPTLKAIRTHYPQSHITLLATKKIFTAPLEESSLIDEIIIFSAGEKIFKQTLNFITQIKKIKKIRQQHFDYCITAFPSNRIQFNLFAFISGSKKRITHQYKYKKIATLSFLQNIRIPSNPQIHDIEQNLNLLQPLGINKPKTIEIKFYLSNKDLSSAEKFWEKNNLDQKTVIGIHPGSGGMGQDLKRWPSMKYSQLINILHQKEKFQILLFGGPEESLLREKITQKTKFPSKIICVNKNLSETAGIIKKCQVFISNDSGLMNIALAVKTPTIAILGPTNHLRTAPFDQENNVTIRKKLDCSPCLNYPFQSNSSQINCPHKQKCLEEIYPEEVAEKLFRLISQ